MSELIKKMFLVGQFFFSLLLPLPCFILVSLFLQTAFGSLKISDKIIFFYDFPFDKDFVPSIKQSLLLPRWRRFVLKLSLNTSRVFFYFQIANFDQSE